MNAWDAYRIRAAELNELAKIEKRAELAEELENLARVYLILAEFAERSSQLDLTYETPIKKSSLGSTDGCISHGRIPWRTRQLRSDQQSTTE